MPPRTLRSSFMNLLEPACAVHISMYGERLSVHLNACFSLLLLLLSFSLRFHLFPLQPGVVQSGNYTTALSAATVHIKQLKCLYLEEY